MVGFLPLKSVKSEQKVKKKKTKLISVSKAIMVTC